MRNLRLQHSVRVADSTELSGSCYLSVDYDTGVLYTASATHVVALDPTSKQVVHQVSLVEDGYISGDGHIVGVQHLPDQMSTCIATSAGDVLLWNMASSQVECMGSVESGISCMAWSPDQELLVLLTGQNTLIMMTREFDPVTEVPIHSDEFGEAEPINVGWGKKETQFHGSEGKSAAVRKQEAVKPASCWDDHQSRLSWRGDGQYFVVSYIHPSSGARQLRTWTRDCVLHSTSQSLDGLEQALSWKPSGSLIASSQTIHNRHDIVFFERNGLQHGNFTLPFGINKMKVREVSWNLESSVLAVWCEERSPEEGTPTDTPMSYIQLWTCGNYHWYLKQQLDFTASSDDRVACMVWDPEHAYKLHIVCAGGQYSQYTWSWATDCTKGCDQQDMATVAVIDGNKLLLTPLRNMVVPPPMCAYYLTLPAPVSMVSFAPPPHSNTLAVLLAHGALHIYKYTLEAGESTCDDITVAAAGGTGFNVCCKTPVVCNKYSVPVVKDTGYPMSGSHLCWIRDDVLLLFSLNPMGSQSVLHQYDISGPELALIHEVELEDYIYNVAVSSVSGTVLLQLLDGTLLTYCPEEHSVTPFESDGSLVSFPIQCCRMAVAKLGGEEVALGLTNRFRFYVNNQQVASNCTSFALHDEFLLLTTLSHTCRCINLNTPLKVLPTLSGDKSHPFDESVRRVERGSRIVHVVPDDTKLILQMPRGNLETVHPRALVLSVVRKLLDKLSYKEAFVLMRGHRLNMNLLYDHQPAVFLQNVSLFIDQIDSVNNLNLFLTDLQEEDVTKTMYTGAYQEQAASSSKKTGSKVDTVCDAMLHTLHRHSSDRYLLSILTAHVKKTTPELEIALAKIQELKKHPDADRTVSAEEALKYLLFLVDVNELYDVALGTYDFELVVMVAEKSQKDPKEYLPFLNELRRMESNYQKFNIDRHLKRYKKALVHVAASGSQHFDECLALVKDQKLYADALKLFENDTDEYKEISVEYGHYLSSRGRDTEAGLIYCKAGKLEAALAVFETSCEWQHAVSVATQLKYSPTDMAQLAVRMSEKLKEGRRHQEAAQLLEQYAEDVEEAIVTLINGHVWQEALRVMYKHNRTDFIESNLRPALVDAHETTLALLTSSCLDFERYSSRLEVVRENKERERLEILEGGGTYNDADADLFSDASSATGESVQSGHTGKFSSSSSQKTGFSKISGRSGKARRKAERKRWSLKEGSRNEDLALIEALSKLIQQAEDSKKETGRLLQALVLFDYDEEASQLQVALDDFLSVIEKTIPTIWDPLQDDTATVPVLGPESTAASIAQAVQSGQGVTKTQDTQLDASLRIPPRLNKDLSWHLHMLKPV